MLVWCVKDRPGHLGQLAPLLLLLPHYPQYQSIQLLSKYFTSITQIFSECKYFSVWRMAVSGWPRCILRLRAGPRSSGNVQKIVRLRRDRVWVRIISGYEPRTLSTPYNTLHAHYAPNQGLDGEMMGQMCQCVSVRFLWNLELWTSHSWNKHETYSTNGIKTKLAINTYICMGWHHKGVHLISDSVTCHLSILMHGLPGYMDLLHKNVIKYQ